MIVSKEIIGLFSVGICFVQYVPLIYLTIKGKKKPHAIARIIWALTFIVAYAAQYYDSGEAGAWSSGVTGVLCILVAIIASRHSKTYITRSDWIAFICVLMAIPAWVLTHNPLYAALWVTLIDLIGYYPLFRKAWHKPHEEMIYVSSLGCLKQFLSMWARGNYSLTTMAYPIAVFGADFAFIFFLMWRRRVERLTAT